MFGHCLYRWQKKKKKKEKKRDIAAKAYMTLWMYSSTRALHTVSRDGCISASSPAAEVYAVKLRFYGLGSNWGMAPLHRGSTWLRSQRRRPNAGLVKRH